MRRAPLNLVGTVRPKRPGCTVALVLGSWAVLLAVGLGLAAIFD